MSDIEFMRLVNRAHALLDTMHVMLLDIRKSCEQHVKNLDLKEAA